MLLNSNHLRIFVFTHPVADMPASVRHRRMAVAPATTVLLAIGMAPGASAVGAGTRA